MKTKILISLIASLSFSLPSVASELDLKKSSVIWKGSKVIGSSHTGTVNIKSAKINLKSGEVNSGNVVIDMTSIKNTDLTDKTWNQKLVGHLKSGDFFAVEKFKTAEFHIEKVQKATDKFYLIKGKLKIKGQSQPLSVRAEVVEDSNSHQAVKVDFKFDRTKFGIKYGSGSFFEGLGDKMISDEIELSIKLHLKKSLKVANN